MKNGQGGNDTAGRKGKLTAKLEMYKNTLKMAWSDGSVGPEEEEMLEDLRSRNNISDQEQRAVEGLVFLELAKMAESRGDADGAEKWYELVARRDTPYESAWKARGMFLAGRDDYRGSREALERAEALHARGPVIGLRPDLPGEARGDGDGTDDGGGDGGEGHGFDGDEGGNGEEDEGDDEGPAGEGEGGGEVWDQHVEEQGGVVEDDDEWAEEVRTEDDDDFGGPEAGGVVDDDDEFDDDAGSGDEGEKVEGTGTMVCPKCGGDVPVLSPRRPIVVACPECGARGRISTAGIPNEKVEGGGAGKEGGDDGGGEEEEDEKEEERGGEKEDVEEDEGEEYAPHGVKDCPKCGTPIPIPSDDRPIIIKCPNCKAQGRLRE